MRFELPGLPASHTTALHSLDFGDVYSSDGRAHPITALIPVEIREEPATVNVSPTVVPAGSASSPQVAPPPADPSAILTGIGGAIADKVFPQHIGARLVVGVIAVGIILLVVWRLVKP